VNRSDCSQSLGPSCERVTTVICLGVTNYPEGKTVLGLCLIGGLPALGSEIWSSCFGLEVGQEWPFDLLDTGSEFTRRPVSQKQSYSISPTPHLVSSQKGFAGCS
jgi:hypothetical protein